MRIFNALTEGRPKVLERRTSGLKEQGSVIFVHVGRASTGKMCACDCASTSFGVFVWNVFCIPHGNATPRKEGEGACNMFHPYLHIFPLCIMDPEICHISEHCVIQTRMHGCSNVCSYMAQGTAFQCYTCLNCLHMVTPIRFSLPVFCFIPRFPQESC